MKYPSLLERDRRSLVWELEFLVMDAKEESSTFTYQGPSPYDNHLGYTVYDLKKYKKLLSSKCLQFLKQNRKEITRLELKTRMAEVIKEARKFLGKTTYKIDPRATPGRNHHTGESYY